MCNCMSDLCVNFLSGAARGCQMNFSANSQSRNVSFYLNNTKRRCEENDFSGPIRYGIYAFQDANCVRFCDSGPGTAWQRDASEHKLNPDRSALVVSQDVICQETLRLPRSWRLKPSEHKRQAKLGVLKQKKKASDMLVFLLWPSRHPRDNKFVFHYEETIVCYSFSSPKPLMSSWRPWLEGKKGSGKFKTRNDSRERLKSYFSI